jgi:hypothetical protein
MPIASITPVPSAFFAETISPALDFAEYLCTLGRDQVRQISTVARPMVWFELRCERTRMS